MTFSKRLKSALVLACALIVTSCGGGGGTAPAGSDIPTTKNWTLMVYIAGDNNLAEFAIADLNELKAAATNANVNVVVQMEKGSTFANSLVGGNLTSTYRGLINGTSTSLTDIGNKNMANKTTLSDFISWSKTSYPATNYGLVLWSHGSGWKAAQSPRSGGVLSRGALADDTSAQFMSLKDIQSGITAGMGAGNKLAVLAFDACLMGHYEVAYQLRNVANYLVASEELVPGPGMPYTQVVNALTVTSPNATPLAFATDMASRFSASYSASTSTTMSVFDLSVADALHTAVIDLATALVANPESGVVTSAKAASNGYGGTGSALFAIDLYKFANHIATNAVNTATRSAASAVTTAITSAVGVRTYITGSAMTGSKGVGIYMPPANAAELGAYISSADSNNAVSGKSTWRDFLNAYYGGSAGSAIKVAGNFAYYITWDNANADVDLVINEPLGNWAAPWIGSTSPNGFLSSDSSFSGQQFESYTAATTVDSGVFDVFVNLYGCKNNLIPCTTNVTVYKKDGLGASFAPVNSGTVGGTYYLCKNCNTAQYPYSNINLLPYTSTGSYSSIITAMWNSSDWYPVTAANITRDSSVAKARLIPLKSAKTGGGNVTK